MCEMLVKAGFDDSVVEVFRSNKIDRVVLLELDRDDMSELGIVALGDRKKLQKMILRLKASGRETQLLTPEPSLHQCSSSYDPADETLSRFGDFDLPRTALFTTSSPGSQCSSSTPYPHQDSDLFSNDNVGTPTVVICVRI